MTKLSDVLEYLRVDAAEGLSLRQTCKELGLEEKWIAQFSKVLRGETVGRRAINEMHKRMRPDGVSGKRYFRPCLGREYSVYSAKEIEEVLDEHSRRS